MVFVCDIFEKPTNWSNEIWKDISLGRKKFSGDISSLKISYLDFSNIDVSQVTKWPSDLREVNWEQAIGINSNQILSNSESIKIPFVKDISELKIKQRYFKK